MSTQQLKTELTSLILGAKDLTALDAARVTALGKKGRITDLMKTLGTMDAETRKTFGAEVNILKDEIAALIAQQEAALKRQEMDQRLSQETTDISLPPRPVKKGSIHPI